MQSLFIVKNGCSLEDPPEGHVVVLLEALPHEAKDAAHLGVLMIPTVQEPAHTTTERKKNTHRFRAPGHLQTLRTYFRCLQILVSIMHQ